MPRNLRRDIEVVTQIVIAIAILVVAGVVVKRYLFPQPSDKAREQARLLKGTSITLPNVNWQQNHKSVVFFLQKDCIYCKYAAPFYRELIEQAGKRQVKLLSVLPDSVADEKNYLQSLDLRIDDVQSGSLSAYKIPATPSVLFVDHSGIIRSAWIGANPNQEKAMRHELLTLFDAAQ